MPSDSGTGQRAEDWYRLDEEELAELSGALYLPASDRLTATRRVVEAIILVRGEGPASPVGRPLT